MQKIPPFTGFTACADKSTAGLYETTTTTTTTMAEKVKEKYPIFELEDHWSCSSPERLSHCKLMRFKLIENRPMKVYAWTLLTPGAWPNLTQGHEWHNL